MTTIILALTLVLPGYLYADSELKRPSVFYDDDGMVLPHDDPNDPKINWEKIPEEPQWKAVAQLVGDDGKGKCSATLFKIPGCNDPKKSAQLLTAGHCVIKNSQRASVDFGKFAGTSKQNRTQAKVKGEIYEAYDNGLDFAITEVDKTYEELARVGIHAMEVATTPVRAGQPLTSVGIPQRTPSGEIPEKDQVIRRSECVTGPTTTVIDTKMMWSNVRELNRCSIARGHSGSSLTSGGKISAIVTMGTMMASVNSDKLNVCQRESCAYDGKSEPTVKPKNYGFDVTFLHLCYKGCTFDIDLAGCPLPDKKSEILVNHAGDPDATNWMQNLDSELVFKSKFPSYGVKGCKGKSDCSCEDPSGYQDAKEPIRAIDYIAGAKKGLAKAGDPPEFHFLCIRGKSADGKYDAIKNVTRYPIFHYSGRKPPVLK